jgi:hypothetical protein
MPSVADPELPSLDVIRAELDLRLAEQERRGAAFDGRATLVVGSGGALIGLVPDDPTLLQLLAQLVSAAAIAAGVWALMPRVAAGIGPQQLRDRYLTRQPEETKLSLLDTRIYLYERDETRLHTKVVRFKWGIGLLGVAVLLLLVGSIVNYARSEAPTEEMRCEQSGLREPASPAPSSDDSRCGVDRQRGGQREAPGRGPSGSREVPQ